MADFDGKEKKKKNTYKELDPKGLRVSVIGILENKKFKETKDIVELNEAQLVRDSEDKLSILWKGETYPITIVSNKNYNFTTTINKKCYCFVLKNPWKDLIQISEKEDNTEKSQNYIAGIDVKYVDAYQAEINNGKNKDGKDKYDEEEKKAYLIQPKISPEPFWGYLENANVYILSGNPGFGGIEEIIDRKSKFKEAMMGNLNRKSSRLIWLDSDLRWDTRIKKEEVEEKYVKGKKEEYIYHPGFDYWEKKTKELRKAIQKKYQLEGNIEKIPLNICIIELFPYHSKKISGEMNKCAKELPSRLFVDYYIEKAIKEGKWIVIARCKSEWLDRIKKLKDYKNASNRVLVTSSQQMSLTQKNLQKEIDLDSTAGKDIWNAFMDDCKK